MWPGFDPFEAAARSVGVLIGVLASLVLIAPEGTRNAFYRIVFSFLMGVIFAPIAANLPLMGWLAGDGNDHIAAQGAAVGFVIWSVLEAIARFMSARDTLDRMLREMARLRGKGDKP